jgi:hypothetical protein
MNTQLETQTFAPAQWLRWIGALTFIGAGASFLVEGWTDAGIIKRQILWAAGTLVLTVFGIGVVRRFRDAIGGRVFLGLAAATIPAHFAQLGSALYAARSSGAGELGSIAVAGVIALLLLPPLALGMSALIRRRGRTLTLLMFIASAPLVIPSREPAFVALLSAAQVGAWLLLEATLFKRDELFGSPEGAAARAMLLLPVTIMLVRNGFHDSGNVWIASTIACPSLLALVWPRIQQHDKLAPVQVLGLTGLFIALPIFGLATLSLLLALSVVLLLGSELVAHKPVSLAWFAIVFFAGAAFFAYGEHTWATSLAIIPLGTIHALGAFRRRNASLFGASVLTTVTGTIAQLVQLVVMPKHDVWIAGAALGVTLLTLASLLDNQKARVQQLAARLQAHFRTERTA